MKTISKYIDEISGKEFKTADEAITSEKKSSGIEKIFSFWNKHPESKGCDFENGGWAYQRTEEDFLKLKDAIIEAVKSYEPWIYKQYEKSGGLTREHLGSGYIIGRFLDDGNAGEIYKYYRILSNVCPVCFREHGQPYYANNCKHNLEVKEF
mgnify:CR=1 FL=1